MTPIEKAARADASSVMAISNTPLFAATQMRDSNSINLFAHSITTKNLLNKIIKLSIKAPKSQAEEAYMYMCTVSIFLQGSTASLTETNPLKTIGG